MPSQRSSSLTADRLPSHIMSLINVLRPKADLPILTLRDLYHYGVPLSPPGASSDDKPFNGSPISKASSEETKDANLEERVFTEWKENSSSIEESSNESIRNETLDRPSEVILIDDHATHPQVIRHLPEKGFYLVQFGPFNNTENNSRHYTVGDICPPPSRQDFVEFPYGSGLTCVRFAMPASSLPSTTVPSEPGIFAFLYEGHRRQNVVGIRDSSQPVNSDIHLFLSEAKDKERVSIDVGNGRTCQYSGVKVLGLFWLTPISILQKNHDTPLLLTIITDDGFGLIQYDGTAARIVQREFGIGPIYNIWWEEISHYLLLETSPGQLKPYVFKWTLTIFTPLRPIDLMLPRWRRLTPSDVSLMKVYGVLK